ncbi:unnamed protein product [Calypogeia fissa]
MWGGENFLRAPGGSHLGSKSAPCSPVKPFQKRAPAQPDSFHVIHKVPLGDSPYVKAKHVQLVDKDPDAAIALFWAAINAGDRVDSALKDMAIVMKQQNRPEEAIEAIKSLRFRCSDAAQESLDNVLLDLYKRCGRLDDQIALLKHKLHLIHQGMAFNGKRTKTARSQGKKFQVSIEQEATRLLGNLGWAYMQQSNFLAAEAVYRKALSIGPDNNKVCNLGICLMKQGRLEEAKTMLQSVVPACPDTRWGSDSHLKSYERAQEMLVELEASMGRSVSSSAAANTLLQSALWQPQQTSSGAVCHQQSQRPAASADVKATDPLADFALPFSGALSATAGFGPTAPAPPPTNRPVEKKMTSVLGQQQQPQQQPHHQRTRSHDLGGTNAQFMGYQSSSFSAAGWDDYELGGYTSPDENVDTNVQGGGGHNENQQQGLAGSSDFQHQMHWPGESIRNKQESFSAALLGSNNNKEIQPLADRKLERSLTFGGTLLKDSNNVYNTGVGSYAYPQQQTQRETHHHHHHQRSASFAGENFSGRIASSPVKVASTFGGERLERAPFTQERPNSVNMCKESSAENVPFKQIASGWGKAAGAPLKSPLGNSELSFFSRWGYNDNNHNNANRSAVRRSLSLESFDTQLEQIALENEEADEEEEEVALPLQPKRPRSQNPVVKENNNMWNSLGFTLSSNELGQYPNHNDDMKHLHNIVSYVVNENAAPQAQSVHVHSGVLTERQQPAAGELESASASSSVGDAEMIKRQRRLRVFQEITLFPGSPQHVI